MTHVNVIIMNKIHVLVMWGIFSSFAHTYFPSCTLKKISLCVVLIESLVMVGNKKRKIFDCQMFLRFVNVSISNLMSRCCKALKKKKKTLKFVPFGRCDVESAYTSEFDLIKEDVLFQ